MDSKLPSTPANTRDLVKWITRKRRGTSNPRLCRFFTWFWFSRDNRQTHWPTTVRVVLGPSCFRVDKGGSRSTIWLRAPGCHGYEYPRQIFIAIGELLRRYRWFQEWNRLRCPKCDNDTFMTRYRDMIDYYYGPVCEEIMCCKKCKEDVSQFMYGSYESWHTTRWEQWETKIFGSVKESAN
jgi:hypothetical protein